MAASTKALAAMGKSDVSAAITAICQLDKVGPATATAILAPFSNGQLPFLSDEVLEIATGKRDYSVRALSEVCTHLKHLCREMKTVEASGAQEWTPTVLERALWVYGQCAAAGVQLNSKGKFGTKRADTEGQSSGSGEVGGRKKARVR